MESHSSISALCLKMVLLCVLHLVKGYSERCVFHSRSVRDGSLYPHPVERGTFRSCNKTLTEDLTLHMPQTAKLVTPPLLQTSKHFNKHTQSLLKNKDKIK